MRCSWCLEDDLPDDAFAKKGNGRSRHCKRCHNAYRKGHYERNKASYIASARRGRASMHVLVDQIKNVPCKDCGREFPPECMDFDHVESKENEIGVLIARCNKAKLLEEIAKCEVVCACCHRIRTRKRASSKGKARGFQSLNVGSSPIVRSNKSSSSR